MLTQIDTAPLDRARVQTARLLLRTALLFRRLGIAALPQAHPMRTFLESITDQVAQLSDDALNPGPTSRLARTALWAAVVYLALLIIDGFISGDSLPTLSWLLGHDFSFVD